jgi:glycosyltransferase involved in cell wall biosynthesis
MATANICFVSAGVYHYLADGDTPSGGAQRQQHLLGQALRDRGRAVAYIVGDYGQPAEQVLDGMLAVRGCPEQLSTPLHAPAVAARFWRAMRRADADVYYVRGAPRLAVLTGIGCRALGRPLVFCVANDADVQPDRLRERYGLTVRRAYRWLLDTADAVVAQTERQQTLLRDKGIESTRIPNGYDIPSEDSVLPADQREFVLWVGRSHRTQKRPGAFLDLARRQSDRQFVMISKPVPGQDCHEELANEASDIDNVDFLGPVAPDAVHGYCRRASMLVNTSRSEGFPNTFLEAWRQATPVVSLSFDLDGLLADGVGGVYAGGPDRLATEVEALAADSGRRESLGWRGRRLVSERFSIGAATDRYEQLLNSLNADTDDL